MSDRSLAVGRLFLLGMANKNRWPAAALFIVTSLVLGKRVHILCLTCRWSLVVGFLLRWFELWQGNKELAILSPMAHRPFQCYITRIAIFGLCYSFDKALQAAEYTDYINREWEFWSGPSHQFRIRYLIRFPKNGQYSTPVPEPWTTLRPKLATIIGEAGSCGGGAEIF